MFLYMYITGYSWSSSDSGTPFFRLETNRHINALITGPLHQLEMIRTQ